MTLRQDYKTTITGQLKELLKKVNIYQVPELKKIVVNVWVWSYLLKWKTSVDDVVDNITKITWQKPTVVNSKLAVSNFKLRKWMPNWVRVTLRWNRMYDFVEKLINVSLPRARDFRWISKKAFDQSWNYNLWLSDVWIFPEIELDDIWKTHWVQITFSVKAQAKDESVELLKALWLPFEK